MHQKQQEMQAKWARVAKSPEQARQKMTRQKETETSLKNQIAQLETKLKTTSKTREESERLSRIVMSQQKQINELMAKLTEHSEAVELEKMLQTERKEKMHIQKKFEMMVENVQSTKTRFLQLQKIFTREQSMWREQRQGLESRLAGCAAEKKDSKARFEDLQKLVETWKAKLQKFEDLEGLYRSKLHESENKTVLLHHLQLKLFVLLTQFRRVSKSTQMRRTNQQKFGSDHTIQRFAFKGGPRSRGES